MTIYPNEQLFKKKYAFEILNQVHSKIFKTNTGKKGSLAKILGSDLESFRRLLKKKIPKIM